MEDEGGVPRSGTGVPGERNDQKYSLPTDEQGVREAEKHDDSRKHPPR